MKKFYLFIAFYFAFFGLSAQTGQGKISGTVTERGNNPVEAATISVQKRSDSSITKISLSSATGRFEVEGIEPGEYFVSVSMAGYQAYSSKSFALTQGAAIELPAIVLEIAASMQAVTVIARKPLIEQRPDRTIVNVDAAVSNVGATALEVLEKSPGVTVDRDGNVSLKGKPGVLVMIDGKPSYLSGADLATLLSSMSANQLDQIEIMTNPPARYDAAGNSGIINIKTKKNKQKGFNGNLSLSYGQGRYWKTNNSLNLNYRGGKVNVFMNYSNNANRGFSDLLINRTYLDTDGKTVTALFEQPTDMLMGSQNNTLRLGVDYSLTKKTTLGVVTSGFISPRTFDGRSIGFLKDASAQIDSIADTRSNNSNRWLNGTVNVNLRQQFNANSELTADLDYITYDMSNSQMFYNSIFYPDGTIAMRDELRGDLPSLINIYSGKIDYSTKLKHDIKLDAGVKSSFVKTNSRADYTARTGGDWYNDYEKSNHFMYQESINAAYVNVNRQWKKWSVQAGLRYENTSYTGNQLGNPQRADSSFTRNYHGLFPTTYLSYNADSNNTFTVSVGRRIDRPAYQQLNPFMFFINKFTYQVGNPYMLPQYTNSIEFSHVYRSMITTTLSYSSTHAVFSQLFRPEGEITILTQGNFGRVQNVGLSVSAQLNPFKWWSATLSPTFNYRRVEGFFAGESVTTEAPNAQVNVNNQFRFNKGWGAELSGFYNSRGVDGQFTIESFGQVSVGVSKQVLNNKGSVKLNIRDMFFTQVINGGIRYGNVREQFVQSRDTRVVNIGFTYRFGKVLKESGGRRNGGSASEELQRVNAN